MQDRQSKLKLIKKKEELMKGQWGSFVPPFGGTEFAEG
jgi:hypothetical protein